MLEAGAPATPHAPLLLGHAATLGGILVGDLEAADRTASHTAPHVGDSRSHTAHRHMRRGFVGLHRGRLAVAARELSAAVALLSSDDPVDILPWCYGLLAQAHAMRDDLAAATYALEQGWAALAPGQVSHRTELVRAEAWVAAADQRPDRARQRLHWLLDHTETTPVRIGLTATDLARLGHLEVASTLLSGLGEATGSRVLTAVEATVLAATAGDTAGVMAAVLTLDTAGLHLYAADLLAAATAGHCDQPALLRRRALTSSLFCEEAATPCLKTLGAQLTPMQRKVARLAAAGHSHRDVGEVLGMSPRTAATHLHRVYKILDVHSREELARLLA
jgi:DNA-binding CsgD family transcriptional regulator